MDIHQQYQSKLCSVEQAAGLIKSGDRIHLSPVAGTPITIIEAMIDRYEELENVQLFSAFCLHPLPIFADDDYDGHINYNAYFLGPLERNVFEFGLITTNSMLFSAGEEYMRDIARCNVAMAGVSPMDDEGYMYYGPMGVSICGIAAEVATTNIVQVTSTMPRTKGEMNRIHVSEVDYIVEQDFPLAPLPEAEITDLDKEIAKFIVPRIRDGSTLQVGLGGLSNAVAYNLEGKRDLGVHTEMITESMMYLANKGVISRPIIGSFALGTRKLYEYTVENELIYLKPVYIINKPETIAAYDDFVSINTCLMVDITGQVASEGIGTRLISSIGGSVDFVRGATHSKGGQSFICLGSTREVDGERISTIAFALPAGTPISVPRCDVQYIVTEYGIADVHNKSLDQRVHALINVAHPDFRDELTAQARAVGYIR